MEDNAAALAGGHFQLVGLEPSLARAPIKSFAQWPNLTSFHSCFPSWPSSSSSPPPSASALVNSNSRRRCAKNLQAQRQSDNNNSTAARAQPHEAAIARPRVEIKIAELNSAELLANERAARINNQPNSLLPRPSLAFGWPGAPLETWLLLEPSLRRDLNANQLERQLFARANFFICQLQITRRELERRNSCLCVCVCVCACPV